MTTITQAIEPNIWITLCKEAEFQRKACSNSEDNSDATSTTVTYDPCKHHPALCGKMVRSLDHTEIQTYNPSYQHPAYIGQDVMEKPVTPPAPPTPEPPPESTLDNTAYVNHYIFPTLLPALAEMLKAAEEERCFIRKRTKFNAMDFLTEYLYKKNPAYDDRKEMQLEDIDFVKSWLADHPRPPLPKSLLWSDTEATLVIQSFWRGFKTRCEENVCELRKWQKEWREENEDVKEKVEDFWSKKMPDETSVEENTGHTASSDK